MTLFRYRQWRHHLGFWCSRRWASSSSPHQTVATRTYLVYTVALNTARDMGSRLMAITIWGLPGKANIIIVHIHSTRSCIAGGGSYAAIAGLTNIPATLFAACIYEFLLTDSDRGGWSWQCIEQYLTKLTSHSGLWMAYGLHQLQHEARQNATARRWPHKHQLGTKWPEGKREYDREKPSIGDTLRIW